MILGRASLKILLSIAGKVTKRVPVNLFARQTVVHKQQYGTDFVVCKQQTRNTITR